MINSNCIMALVTYNKHDMVLDNYQYNAILALRDFSENAFCGYAPGHGREQEVEVLECFAWTVCNFINLIEATHESYDDLLDKERTKWEKEMDKIINKTKLQ